LDTKPLYQTIIFAGLIFVLIAQAAPKTKQQLMDEAIQQKLDSYTLTHVRRCEKDVQERALEIVDSLLLLVANTNTIDTFTRPAKPTKPNRPAIRPARDTMPIKPLFDQ